MSKAYVMMNCNLGEEQIIIESLKKIVGIKEAHGTLGLYDIVAQIECTTDEKIQEIVTQKIRKIPKIQTSMTLTSFRVRSTIPNIRKTSRCNAGEKQ